MKTYTVKATREGAWWALYVPELDVATQSRRLDQADAMVRDLISVWLEVDPKSFAVDIAPSLDPDVARAAGAVRKATKDAAAAVEAAAVATRAFAADLLRKGYTVRDAGAILGVSPQRVSQLTANTPHVKPNSPRLTSVKERHVRAATTGQTRTAAAAKAAPKATGRRVTAAAAKNARGAKA